MSLFSKAELERYSRHLIIPEFNMEGQRRLKESRVLVVGAGGLGSPLLQYLTAAGVGTIGVVDFDEVDTSNLQRQVLYTVDDVGQPKATQAAKKMERLNPHIRFNTYTEPLTAANAREIIGGYDIIADGTDNFPTRYLVNDACVMLGKTNVYASIFRFEGQVSVFNHLRSDGTRGPHYRDLFPEPPPPGMVPSCAEGGVLGVLPGIIGSVQANEVIKIASGVGDPLDGRLFLFDAYTFETRVVAIPTPTEPTSVTELIDYEAFCGIAAEDHEETMQHKSVTELKALLDEDAAFQLIDVREPYEREIATLGGVNIPLDELASRTEEIGEGIKVVYCRTGVRSKKAIRKLQKLGFSDLYNLEGGIHAWAATLDANMAKY